MINRPGVKFKTVGQYIRALPVPVRAQAEKLRRTIRDAAPQAKEVISYNMPAFRMNGTLVYFAGYTKHIGFYPTAAPIRVFKAELSRYATSKGAIRFPLERGIPASLVRKIVKYRIEEDVKRGASRRRKKV